MPAKPKAESPAKQDKVPPSTDMSTEECDEAEESGADMLDVGECKGVIDVECGSNKARMFLSKLCLGSKGKCVLFEGGLMTPNQFQLVSGRETAKDWKRSIRHHGKSMKLLLAKNVATSDPAACRCEGCHPTANVEEKENAVNGNVNQDMTQQKTAQKDDFDSLSRTGSDDDSVHSDLSSSASPAQNTGSHANDVTKETAGSDAAGEDDGGCGQQNMASPSPPAKEECPARPNQESTTEGASVGSPGQEASTQNCQQSSQDSVHPPDVLSPVTAEVDFTINDPQMPVNSLTESPRSVNNNDKTSPPVAGTDTKIANIIDRSSPTNVRDAKLTSFTDRSPPVTVRDAKLSSIIDKLKKSKKRHIIADQTTPTESGDTGKSLTSHSPGFETRAVTGDGDADLRAKSTVPPCAPLSPAEVDSDTKRDSASAPSSLVQWTPLSQTKTNVPRTNSSFLLAALSRPVSVPALYTRPSDVQNSSEKTSRVHSPPKEKSKCADQKMHSVAHGVKSDDMNTVLAKTTWPPGGRLASDSENMAKSTSNFERW